MLLLQLGRVVGGVLPLEALEIAGALSYVVAQVLGGRVEVVGGGEVAVVVPVEVETTIGLEAQPFDRLVFDVNVADDLVGLVVSPGEVEPAQRVDVLLLDPWGLGEAEVGLVVIDRGQRVVGEGVGLDTAEGAIGADVVVLRPVQVEVLADGQEVLDLLGRVVAHGVALVVGLLPTDDAVLVPVVKGDVAVVPGGGDAVVDDLRRVEDLLHPVGAGGERVAEVGEAQYVQRGGLVAVGEFLAHQDHVVLGPEHGRKLPGLGVQVAGGVGDARVSLASILGGDDDHTIGGPGSVDGA